MPFMVYVPTIIIPRCTGHNLNFGLKDIPLTFESFNVRHQLIQSDRDISAWTEPGWSLSMGLSMAKRKLTPFTLPTIPFIVLSCSTLIWFRLCPINLHIETLKFPTQTHFTLSSLNEMITGLCMCRSVGPFHICFENGNHFVSETQKYWHSFKRWDYFDEADDIYIYINLNPHSSQVRNQNYSLLHCFSQWNVS